MGETPSCDPVSPKGSPEKVALICFDSLKKKKERKKEKEKKRKENEKQIQ